MGDYRRGAQQVTKRHHSIRVPHWPLVSLGIAAQAFFQSPLAGVASLLQIRLFGVSRTPFIITIQIEIEVCILYVLIVFAIQASCFFVAGRFFLTFCNAADALCDPFEKGSCTLQEGAWGAGRLPDIFDNPLNSALNHHCNLSSRSFRLFNEVAYHAQATAISAHGGVCGRLLDLCCSDQFCKFTVTRNQDAQINPACFCCAAF